MKVVSEGPFTVAAVRWQPQPGSHAMTLVCKATYRLQAGVSRLAEEQEPPYAEDHFSREDARCSLYAISDLAPGRPQADVMLVGRACAPGGVPAERIVTRLAVGRVEKRVEVCAHRYYEAGGALRWGSPLVRMSLWYERAAGGAGTDNPVGMRTARRSDGRTYLPNLQPAGMGDPGLGVAIPTACYGPIAPSWPSRRRQLSAVPRGWDAASWWEVPLPAELDLAFFNAAPADQQVPRLDDDQQIVLENLLPDRPRLQTRLWGIRPRAVAQRPGGRRESIELAADTLWIDTVRGICTLVWRGRLALRERAERGTVEISQEPRRRGPRSKPPPPPRRRPAAGVQDPPADESGEFRPEDTSPTLRQRRPERPPGPAEGRPDSVTFLSAVEREDTEPTQTRMPRPGAAAPSPSPPDVAAGPGEPARARPSHFGHEPTQVLPAEWARPSDPGWATPLSPDELSYEALPGTDGSEGWNIQQMLAEADEGDTVPDAAAAEAAASETVTLTGPIEGPADPLPFRPAPQLDEPGPPRGAEPAPPPVDRLPPPAAGDEPRQPAWVRPTAVQSLGKVQELRRRKLGPSPWAGERPASGGATGPLPGDWQPQGDDANPEQASLPPPPPIMGPLATYEMVREADGAVADQEKEPRDRAASEAAIAAGIAAGWIEEAEGAAPSASAGVSEEQAEAAAASQPPHSADVAAAGVEGGEPSDESELVPVEQCAAMAASIDRSPHQREAVLERHEISAEQWRALEAHWNDAISDETGKGRSALLRAYDTAYVAQLEEERGPLEPFEYARLVVAAETGDAGDVLAALELPRGALLRVERVMASRVADNASLAEKVRKAIQKARKKR